MRRHSQMLTIPVNKRPLRYGIDTAIGISYICEIPFFREKNPIFVSLFEHSYLNENMLCAVFDLSSTPFYMPFHRKVYRKS